MKSAKRMIDSALTVCKTKSAIARTLGISPQRLWHYESGMKHMPAHLVMRLATLANMNSVNALGQYEAEWAGKKIWRAAAGIAGAVFTLVALSVAHGDASAYTLLDGSRLAHYAQRRVAWLLRIKRGARRLAGLMLGEASTSTHAQATSGPWLSMPA